MTNLPALQTKFGDLRNALDSELVERADVIDTMLLALISKTHHFQLGSPGVAKSYSIRMLESHIDGFGPNDSFEVLLTRFSTMEEVWGPYDLKALDNGRYSRISTNMLPMAKFGFLDEIFKCSSSLLNSLLWALNERQYRNDGRVIDIPLWTMFCASNELPESEELNALYDRIHFRVVTKPIQESSAFVQMLTDRKQSLSGVSNQKILTWGEIETAYAEASAVEIPKDVLEALNGVRNKLADEGILPTDRRFVESLRIIKAAAWLDGETVADVEHVRSLAHVMWSVPEEIAKVQRILLELANPLDKRALEILESLETMEVSLDKLLKEEIDAQLKSKRGVELYNRLDRISRDVKELTTEITASGRKSAKLEQLRVKEVKVTRILLKEVFNIAVPEEQ